MISVCAIMKDEQDRVADFLTFKSFEKEKEKGKYKNGV